jgi:predicted nucleic acid-binding protein
MFVIDASVALAWCFVDEASGDADDVLGRLERETALAPAHWPLEVANALRTAERRGRLDATDLPRLRALLAALPVEIAPVELTTAVGGVLEAARTYDLSAYDAAYLDLAAARAIPLATIEGRLRAASARAGVELVG